MTPVNFQGNPDRHEQILAAVSPEAEKLNARPDSETELSNPKFRKHYRMRVKQNSAAPDFFNTFWFAGLVIVVFLVAVWLTG